MTNENRVTVILVVVVGLLALVAIVISAVSLTRSIPATTINTGSSGGSSGGGGQPQNFYIQPSNTGGNSGGQSSDNSKKMGQFGRIYSIGIGHDYGAHEYFDQKGYLSGFAIGFIDLVCSEAMIDCRVVWDRYVNCWDSQPGQHATGGQGLHDRWYDACAGWYTTIERTHVFQFTQAYLKKPPVHFYTLATQNFDADNQNNVKNSKILFLDGWASDEKCLARESGAIKTTDTIKYVSTPEEAVKQLQDNSLGFKAIFTTSPTLDALVTDGTLRRIPKVFSCMIDGNAMMSRKDSDFTDQWNKGFNKVKNNGRFRKYCEETNQKHLQRGKVDCIDTY